MRTNVELAANLYADGNAVSANQWVEQGLGQSSSVMMG
jgi:predicted HicB family RNase H-like nuclease